MDLESEYKEETSKRPTKVQGNLAYYTGDYVKWLEDKIAKLTVKPSSTKLPCRYEIDFGGNLLAEIKTTDSSFKVLRCVDGWGEVIDTAKVKIDEVQR